MSNKPFISRFNTNGSFLSRFIPPSELSSSEQCENDGETGTLDSSKLENDNLPVKVSNETLMSNINPIDETKTAKTRLRFIVDLKSLSSLPATTTLSTTKETLKRCSNSKNTTPQKKVKSNSSNDELESENTTETTGSKFIQGCISKLADRSKMATIMDNLVDDIPICTPIGRKYTLGKETFISKNDLYKTEMSDYTIITDSQFNINLAPKEIKPLLGKRWVYKLHVHSTLSPVITRDSLRARVEGGQILAYRYNECSIEGNPCVYYGFIPTISQKFQDGHKTCYISSMQVWPRKLYVFLKQAYPCTCSRDCQHWSYRLNDYHTTTVSCKQKIKWEQIYIMMGDYDKNCLEQIQPSIRSCKVCAQCYDCSKTANFCRKHRICKHKTAKPLEEILSLCGSSIKECKKY